MSNGPSHQPDYMENNERYTDKLAKTILLVGAVAIIAALCWYFRSVITYVLIAVVVSLVAKPLVGLMQKIRIKDNQMDIDGAPVVIEDNVWIGANVTVMPGVTIGKHSVVAAGSVVTTDIPPDTMAAGVPAKIIKKLKFTEE